MILVSTLATPKENSLKREREKPKTKGLKWRMIGWRNRWIATTLIVL